MMLKRLPGGRFAQLPNLVQAADVRFLLEMPYVA